MKLKGRYFLTLTPLWLGRICNPWSWILRFENFEPLAEFLLRLLLCLHFGQSFPFSNDHSPGTATANKTGTQNKMLRWERACFFVCRKWRRNIHCFWFQNPHKKSWYSFPLYNILILYIKKKVFVHVP